MTKRDNLEDACTVGAGVPSRKYSREVARQYGANMDLEFTKRIYNGLDARKAWPVITDIPTKPTTVKKSWWRKFYERIVH